MINFTLAELADEAPVFILNDIVSKQVAQLENGGLAQCTIFVDEIFTFVCKQNEFTNLSDNQKEALDFVYLADTRSILEDQNCIENCKSGSIFSTKISQGTYDFLMQEGFFKASEVIST